MLDLLEKIYLVGFIPLQIFAISFPILVAHQQKSHSGECVTVDVDGLPCPTPSSWLARMEFLPLLVTSVYCAVGIVWGYLRLIFVYLHEETTYQGQLSEIQ